MGQAESQQKMSSSRDAAPREHLPVLIPPNRATSISASPPESTHADVSGEPGTLVGLRSGGGEDRSRGLISTLFAPPRSWKQLGSLHVVHRAHGGGVFLPRPSPAILSSAGRKDDSPCWDRTSFTMDTAFTFYVPK